MLRVVTNKENEKEIANPSADREMDIYLAESKSALIARSDKIIFLATEGLTNNRN